jgi:HSP20 family protein
MGALFDTVFEGVPSTRRPLWQAPASVWEQNDRFHVEVDVPGVDQSDLELTLEKGSLTITAERRAPEGERANVHDERGYGKITRVVTLPDTADADTLEAALTGGVLHVSVAKKPEAQARRIEVRTT